MVLYLATQEFMVSTTHREICSLRKKSSLIIEVRSLRGEDIAKIGSRKSQAEG
jgi:hypothetical protein